MLFYTHMTKSILYLLLLSFITISISSCTKPIPVRHGNVINISKESIYKDEDNLAIHWFGTSNYLISLGSNSIMTDPYISYQYLIPMLTRSTLRSNDEYIKEYYGNVDRPVPNAIFIGHSHYDHLMDTVPFLELKKEKGCNIPVYGSSTTKNIMHGYSRHCDCNSTSISTNDVNNKRWSFNSKLVETLGDWKPIDIMNCERPTIEQNSFVNYKAYEVDHANQLEIGPFKFQLFKGHVMNPLKDPPDNAYNYRLGYTYLYLFKLSNKSKDYTVALTGAATNVNTRYNQVSHITDEVDVLILCVPGWKYKDQYPKELIKKLKPRYIILSHFDDFFETDRDKRPINDLPFSGLDEFILQIQDDINSIDNYDRFEKIIIPDVDSTIYLSK